MYLLILGPPRSGTTLLTSMIGCHSDVALINEDFEFSFKKIISKKVIGNKLCIPHQIDMKKKRKNCFLISILRRIPQIKKNSKKILYPLSEYSIEEFLKLDNSKIIIIIRNGNDVISSINKRGEKSIKVAKYRWLKAIEIGYTLKKKYPKRVLITSFEKLVNNPENTMKKSCKFLGLSFQEDMMEGYKYNPFYKNNSGVDKTKVNRYKKEGYNFNIEETFPEIYNKYIKLMNLASE